MVTKAEVNRVLAMGRWTGTEVARMVLASADALARGEVPGLTEAEAAALRRGLSPAERMTYVSWAEGWLLLEDHLLPAGRIALLEATRALLAAEVVLTQVLDLAVYRSKDVEAVTAWATSVRSMLEEVQRYTTIRGRTLAWLAASADVFMTALGLTTLQSGALFQELTKELEAAVAHATEPITLLKAIDIELPELPPLGTLWPDKAALRELDRRISMGRSTDWTSLWQWWLTQAEALPALR
jgi:hypothetical protein